MNRVYIYGISGVSNSYRPVGYERIWQDEATITNLRNKAVMLETRWPEAVEVYAIDDRHDLADDYRMAISDKRGIEGPVVFRDILQREGIRII